jgi:hypothetical protein
MLRTIEWYDVPKPHSDTLDNRILRECGTHFPGALHEVRSARIQLSVVGVWMLDEWRGRRRLREWKSQDL